MKMKILMTAVMFASIASANDLDVLKGDTLERTAAPVAKLSRAQESAQKIDLQMRQTCNLNGCPIFVDTGKGREFKLTAGAGVGQPLDGYGGGNGFNLYATQNSGNYGGIQGTLIISNYTCTRYALRQAVEGIANFLAQTSSPEFIEQIIKKGLIGEDQPVPEYVKMWLMLIPTLRPAGPCTNGISGNGR